MLGAALASVKGAGYCCPPASVSRHALLSLLPVAYSTALASPTIYT